MGRLEKETGRVELSGGDGRGSFSFFNFQHIYYFKFLPKYFLTFTTFYLFNSEVTKVPLRKACFEVDGVGNLTSRM